MQRVLRPFLITSLFSMLACGQRSKEDSPPSPSERRAVPASPVSNAPPLADELVGAENGSEVPPPAAAVPPMPAYPTLTNAGAEDCSAGDRVALGQSNLRRFSSVSLAASAERALVMWPLDSGRIVVRAVGADGTPAAGAVTLDMPAASRPFGMWALDSGRFVVSTHSLCTDTPASHASKCVYLRVLDADGGPLGEPYSHKTHEWAAADLIEVQGERILFPRGHRYIPSELDQFTVNGSGEISAESLRSLSDEGGDQPPAPAGLAADATRWGLLTTRYHPDRDRELMELHLSTGETQLLRGFAESTTVHAFELSADGFAMVFTPGGGRPRFVALALDGSRRGDAVRIERGAALPEPFGDRIALELLMGRSIQLRRTTLAGDRVGQDTSLTGRATGGGDTAFVGGTVLTTWAEGSRGELTVGVTRVDCAG